MVGKDGDDSGIVLNEYQRMKKLKAEVDELYVRKRVRRLSACTYFYWCKQNLRKFYVYKEKYEFDLNRRQKQEFGPTILLSRGYGLIAEKNILQTDFEGKKILARKYLGGKISYTFMAYNPGNPTN